MTEGPGFRADRPLSLSELLGAAFAVLRRCPGTLLVIAAAIVIPVQLVVSGIGLEQLTAGYHAHPTVGEAIVPSLVSFLVVNPLVTAAAIDVLAALDRDERPRPFASLQAGFDAFAPLFVCLLISAVGIGLGLVALVIPGVYLAVRWFFVPQAVVLEGARFTDALSQSAHTTNGQWWRTFGTVVVANLIVGIPGVLILTPFNALAKSVDRDAVTLAGSILVDIATAPFLAVLATLLYRNLQLHARLA